MKTTFTLFIALTIFSQSFAQNPDKVLARVNYTYFDKTDTLSNGKPRSENMLLFVGKNASLYTSYDKIRHEISEEQKFRAKIANRVGNGQPTAFIIDDTDSKWMTTTTYLYFVKEDKFFIKEFIALQSYLLEDDAAEIKWKISKDTLTFSGIPCQKATANYEGKNWTAWFAPTIPFQSGPWKLHSLPGLIIEAYDENKQIYFQFAGLEDAKPDDHVRDHDITKRPDADPNTFNAIDQLIGRDVGNAYFENIIRLPIGAIKITKQQLVKFKDAFKKDPKGFVKAQSGH
ncbi:MAG TPA: GLPGLI family protein [Pedobacter sp.]|nr:GLPGLI family protein [Pedobacter sp.]